MKVIKTQKQNGQYFHAICIIMMWTFFLGGSRWVAAVMFFLGDWRGVDAVQVLALYERTFPENAVKRIGTVDIKKWK